MNVACILAVKGRDVITTQPHRTLAEAAELLASKSIGAIVVCGSDGYVLGILSERDIVNAIARRGASSLQEPVSSQMTEKVITAAPDTSVQDLMETMTKGRFRHIPVIEGGRLAGLISIGDVVKWHVEEIETEHRAMREYIASA
jgi:CBS domain-containing protein